MARRWMRRKGARPKPAQMNADIGACLHIRIQVRARTGGARAGVGGDRTCGGTVLEDDEILCGVERKVLDAHAEVVHDQPRLTRGAGLARPRAAPGADLGARLSSVRVRLGARRRARLRRVRCDIGG